MSAIHFYHPGALIWLWLVPASVGLFVYAGLKRKKAVRAFGAGAAVVGRKREAVGCSLAIALTVFALARPAWKLKEHALQESGRDVIFLLDVSKSMLAEDLYPSRLENAKTAILDCVETLYGDRVALVLFAGSAEIHCPLTVDYDYFRMALRQATPESVALGGTMMAGAIEKVADKLIDPAKAGAQDLILITDGEDTVKNPGEVEAARELGTLGTRLITIGLGDRKRGSRILTTDETTGLRSFMKDGRGEVWTRLQSETLRNMATAVPGGVYFEVATGPFNLKRMYQQVMKHAKRTPVDAEVMERFEDHFHLFLAGAVAALLGAYRWRETS